jgi:DNA-binding transcriptional LysR family regulator
MDNERVTVPQITWSELQLLRGVAATGAILGAARTAGLDQSTANRKLLRMTRRIGVQLTAGSPDRLRLTEPGGAIMTAGLRLLWTLDKAVGQIAADNSGSTLRTLRLASASDGLEEFVDDVATALPTILPHVLSADLEECIELFSRYAADAIYTWRTIDDTGRLSRPSISYEVLDEPLWVGIPAAHPAARKPAVRMLDLEADSWITGPDEGTQELLILACREAGFEPLVRQIADAHSVIRSLLWRGHGVALLSPVSVPPTAAANFVLRPLQDGPRRTYRLITDPTVIPDRLARALCQRLRISYRLRATRVNPTYQAAYADVTGESPDVPDQIDLTSLAAAAPTDDSDYRLQLEDLVVLRTIRENGSLNRAAPLLLISQPALTRRLKLLEHRLGFKLLIRSYRGTVLTASAEQLLDAVTDAERAFYQVIQHIQETYADGRRVVSGTSWAGAGPSTDKHADRPGASRRLSAPGRPPARPAVIRTS